MAAIVKRSVHSFASAADYCQNAGLWRYVPVKDSKNQAYCDVMLLLPGIKKNRDLQVMIRQQLQETLEAFGDQVLFADLNLRLGIVWVTVVPEPGLCSDVADAIRQRVEGARIVGNYIKPAKPARLSWAKKFKCLLARD